MATTPDTTVVNPNEVNIDAMTYTQSAFGSNFFFLDQLLDRMAPISKIIGEAPRVTNLGTLSVLSHELLYLILEELSIVDLMQFRGCNRLSSDFVGSMLKPVLSIAPNTIKGMLALEVTTHITIRQLSRKLRQSYCDGKGCGALAQYMFLPICARLCYRCCALKASDFQFIDFIREWELDHVRPDDAFFETQPSFRMMSVTFTNGLNKFKFTSRDKIYPVDRRHPVVKAALRQSLGWHLDAKPTCELFRQKYEFTIPPSAMHFQMSSRDEMTVIKAPIFDRLMRHMCVVFAPWSSSTGSLVKQGLFCSTCLYTNRQYTLYTRETFLEHLKDCRVLIPNQGYFRRLMPIDNTNPEDPREVWQLSLVADSE